MTTVLVYGLLGACFFNLMMAIYVDIRTRADPAHERVFRLLVAIFFLLAAWALHSWNTNG